MDEYIKRQQVIDELNKEGYTKNMRVHRHILDIPSSDVKEVVHAHWIHWSRSDECSNCGHDTGKYESPSKFCPSCGAKMDEEEDE